jgi:hypothetical protein
MFVHFGFEGSGLVIFGGQQGTQGRDEIEPGERGAWTTYCPALKAILQSAISTEVESLLHAEGSANRSW